MDPRQTWTHSWGGTDLSLCVTIPAAASRERPFLFLANNLDELSLQHLQIVGKEGWAGGNQKGLANHSEYKPTKTFFLLNFPLQMGKLRPREGGRVAQPQGKLTAGGPSVSTRHRDGGGASLARTGPGSLRPRKARHLASWAPRPQGLPLPAVRAARLLPAVAPDLR